MPGYDPVLGWADLLVGALCLSPVVLYFGWTLAFGPQLPGWRYGWTQRPLGVVLLVVGLAILGLWAIMLSRVPSVGPV